MLESKFAVPQFDSRHSWSVQIVRHGTPSSWSCGQLAVSALLSVFDTNITLLFYADVAPSTRHWTDGNVACVQASVPNAEGAATLNNVSVTPSIVPPVAINGTFPSWRLLRIDVKKLTLQVNHHFDYIKDGHARKYQQHIESTSSKDWKVYLTRKKDDWHIPYEEINSITLIALLRMGLHPSIKSRFYGQFLRPVTSRKAFDACSALSYHSSVGCLRHLAAGTLVIWASRYGHFA
jgi:hypothetical protein